MKSQIVQPQNLDKPLKQRPEVSLSVFSHLFNEFTQQLIKNNEKDIEVELHDLGKPLGPKVLELTVYREKALTNNNNICQYGKRETKVVNMLHYINNQVWKTLFNKQADGIEQSEEDQDEYRIIDSNPLTNKYISSG